MPICFDHIFGTAKERLNVVFRLVHVFILILLVSSPFYAEASIVTSHPFWMPLEFEIGNGYFKVNVFILNQQENAGLIKVCAIAINTDHRLCHYMNAMEEEHQTISPNVPVHAGIFVFPSFQVPVNSEVDVCVSTLNDDRMTCKTITNTDESKEEIVDIDLE